MKAFDCLMQTNASSWEKDGELSTRLFRNWQCPVAAVGEGVTDL